jgi:hypothetical protein
VSELVKQKKSFDHSYKHVSRPFNSSEHFHALSLLYIIFAIATLFDSNTQPYSSQAQVYYHLSRTSLSFAPPYLETTLASIQTLVSSIFCTYQGKGFSERKSEDPYGSIP